MGLLIDGVWTPDKPPGSADDGQFKRWDARFRNWITRDGSPGLSGSGDFKAEPDRYHLYVSYACPWAHRTLIYRAIKGLEDIVGLSVTHWSMGDNGWTFEPDDDVVPDSVNGTKFVHQLYAKAEPSYSGRASVPVLWDKKRNTIVSNESSEIIRMFDTAFEDVGGNSGSLLPANCVDEIEQINERVYNTLNNGVYKCGFARTQAAYESAVEPLFETLDWLENKLSERRYLLGNEPTEADWRLFPTLYRFDAVYNVHFKCSRRRLVDYPNLWAYARDLYQQPRIAATTNMDHVRRHYFQSHESINPRRIVPVLPAFADFDLPHERDGISPAISG